MAEDKKKQANEAGQQSTEENVRGSVYNSQNPVRKQPDAQRDISDIDQHEGNMEHGEKGANFNETREEG